MCDVSTLALELHRRRPDPVLRHALCTASVVMSLALGLTALTPGPFTATLSGTITNHLGEPLPGAIVALHDTETGSTYYTKADSAGKYSFSALSPGTYRLKVTLDGFDPWQNSNLQLAKGDDIKADPSLIGVGSSKQAASTSRKSKEDTGNWAATSTSNILEVLAPLLFLVFGVVLARWLLMHFYRAAVVRQMRQQKEPVADHLPRLHGASQANVELREVQAPSVDGIAKAARASRAARRQAIGRWAALVAAVLAQQAALALFGGVTLIENPNAPWFQIVALQAQLLLGTGFFLLAIVAPGLIRSGQTSAVSWWLFAAPVGLLLAIAPLAFMGEERKSFSAFAATLVVCLVLGYLILVACLSAVFLAKRWLHLSPEGFAFVLSGSVAAACNAAVLVLQTGTSLHWWALFVSGEIVILPAPYLVGLWTRPRGEPSRLLFLRRFGNAAAADRLLHTICRTWLTSGDIHLIVGPDTAASTASPEGVLRFATLLMNRHFIRSSGDLDRRLRNARWRPGLDGRCEVHEYPCFENTWRSAMEALAGSADVILVDVRGYTAANLGTAFELGMLGALGALARTLLIVDDSTPAQSVHEAIAAGGLDGQVSAFRLCNRKTRSEVVPVLFSSVTACHQNRGTAPEQPGQPAPTYF